MIALFDSPCCSGEILWAEISDPIYSGDLIEGSDMAANAVIDYFFEWLG